MVCVLFKNEKETLKVFEVFIYNQASSSTIHLARNSLEAFTVKYLIYLGFFVFCIEITCGQPVIPSNGELIGDKYSVNRTVTYDCKAGYSLKGTRTHECGVDGNWNANIPTCRGEKTL